MQLVVIFKVGVRSSMMPVDQGAHPQNSHANKDIGCDGAVLMADMSSKAQQ